MVQLIRQRCRAGPRRSGRFPQGSKTVAAGLLTHGGIVEFGFLRGGMEGEPAMPELLRGRNPRERRRVPVEIAAGEIVGVAVRREDVARYGEGRDVGRALEG